MAGFLCISILVRRRCNRSAQVSHICTVPSWIVRLGWAGAVRILTAPDMRWHSRCLRLRSLLGRYGGMDGEEIAARNRLLAITRGGDPGGAAVAAPIRDASGATVAVVYVSVPESRFTSELRRRCIEAIRRGADRLAADLGYRDRSADLTVRT